LLPFWEEAERTSGLSIDKFRIFHYVFQIADKGYEKAMEENEALRRGLNLIDGKLVCQGVADSFGMSFIQNPFSLPFLKIPS
jgi:alanine dehydrogenase